MNRRNFLLSALAAALAACSPAAVDAAPPFEPTRFSVQVSGRGPDVILIPGLTSGREVWQSTVRAVPGYRYHLVQVAGFAGEPVRGNRQGPVVAPVADEIARYIADRGLRRPAIVGHSMGGTLAMMIGTRHPDLVGRIMVVDILPQPAGLFGGTSADMGPLAQSIMSSPSGRRLFGSLVAAFSPPDASNRLSDSDVVARAMHDLAGMDLGPQLPRLRAPLTVVYAAPDPSGRAAIDRSFANAYAPARGARLVRIDGSGHMVMLDQPERFAAAMRNFLAR
ncbi:alpha/beta fold hydrolase [Sphingosinicella sp. CPCC 101087]|uniref:alpha/beta fold hydrolase n=1 Tax=Sphingosinicella sp. CPCC 101087 TaxID=2497754 RepID=UPI00101DDDBE|nr:alpha/beta hydrolase [Sphingosinicella sp. CPCC 101087]